MDLEIIILAAGNSTRMKSNVPKVLHPLGGEPLLSHVLRQAESLQPNATHIVVSESNQDQVRSAFNHDALHWVLQQEQLGTGHAVLQAIPDIKDDSIVLVLYGDVPRLRSNTLRRCLAAGENGLAVLSAKVSDPTGYGRIIRDENGRLTSIVEDRDLDPGQCLIDEINSGIMCGSASLFRRLLPKVTTDNRQKEIYLTDVVGLAVEEGIKVEGVLASSEQEILGVNSRRQLADMEQDLQRELATQLMDAGVTLDNPESVTIRGTLKAGMDCTIGANVVVEGNVRLGENVEIGQNCIIKDAVIGDGSRILPQTMIEGAEIGEDCGVGPSARLRPGTILHDEVRVGNFVEIKNATLETGVKAGHLAYIGDAYIGAHTNFGAGAITCNFDGHGKNRTEVGKNAFIGTNCSLIAPINIPDGAFIAAGTTITKKTNVGEGDLALARPEVQVLRNWSKRRGLGRAESE